MTNLEKALEIIGWQGGTIHQVASATGFTVSQILEAEDVEALFSKDEHVEIFEHDRYRCSCGFETTRESEWHNHVRIFNICELRGSDG
jgi:hypothetical protein